MLTNKGIYLIGLAHSQGRVSVFAGSAIKNALIAAVTKLSG